VAKLGESGPEAAQGGQERFAKENHKENGRVPMGVAKLGESGPEATKCGEERFAKENHKENNRVPGGCPN